MHVSDILALRRDTSDKPSDYDFIGERSGLYGTFRVVRLKRGRECRVRVERRIWLDGERRMFILAYGHVVYLSADACSYVAEMRDLV